LSYLVCQDEAILGDPSKIQAATETKLGGIATCPGGETLHIFTTELFLSGTVGASADPASLVGQISFAGVLQLPVVAAEVQELAVGQRCPCASLLGFRLQ
jgi:hypothetical protein